MKAETRKVLWINKRYAGRNISTRVVVPKADATTIKKSYEDRGYTVVIEKD